MPAKFVSFEISFTHPIGLDKKSLEIVSLWANKAREIKLKLKKIKVEW